MQREGAGFGDETFRVYPFIVTMNGYTLQVSFLSSSSIRVNSKRKEFAPKRANSFLKSRYLLGRVWPLTEAKL